MKKVIAMMMAAVMVFSIAACGSKTEQPAEAEAPAAPEAPADSEAPGGREQEEAPEAVAGELTKVGVAFMKSDPFMVP
ncbi:sugar ABC transporter substrate-binding protein, partial [Escherichia coli]|nr:sugar ABC transporter substrate-binding protein [Escherichia coli]